MTKHRSSHSLVEAGKRDLVFSGIHTKFAIRIQISYCVEFAFKSNILLPVHVMEYTYFKCYNFHVCVYVCVYHFSHGMKFAIPIQISCRVEFAIPVSDSDYPITIIMETFILHDRFYVYPTFNGIS